MSKPVAKYQKYAEYQDSGVEWLGEIPSHWTTCSLSKLFSIKAGGDVDLRNFSEDQSDEYLYPIYTNANDAKAVYGYSKVANYKANSITVSGRGEVGFAVHRDHAFDAIIRLLVLSPQKECEPKFFAYFINEVINFRVESSAIGQLSTLQISPYKIVLPSLSEQKSVVDYLDHETAKIDSLIAKQEKLIELLKEKRQAVISHAVTKGLNPDVNMKDSGVEWIGEIPSHWTTCSLSKLFNIKAGGDVDLRNFSEDQSDEYLYPIYTNANDAKAVYGYSKVANYKANSITVSGRGEVGFAVHRDHAFDAIIRLLVLSPQKECEPKFFAYFINEVINFRVESSAIGQLSTLQISPYKIVLPSLSEQKSVVDYLDHETAKIDSLIAKQEKLIQLMQERRTALISSAVTGKIDVRNWQNPNHNNNGAKTEFGT